MTQWFPKLAEYDFEGWHPNPYIAREFHGVWGDYDVKITIDKNYILGGTGYLQNSNEIGYGYQSKNKTVDHSKKEALTWHFYAPNVHDFTWAADPDFYHDVVRGPNDVELHFLYNQAKQKVSSGGSCKANARDIFEAKASLGGAIGVYGSPKTLNQTISLGGNITEIKK
jgi:hypothetical protein